MLTCVQKSDAVTFVCVYGYLWSSATPNQWKSCNRAHNNWRVGPSMETLSHGNGTKIYKNLAPVDPKLMNSTANVHGTRLLSEMNCLLSVTPPMRMFMKMVHLLNNLVNCKS